MRSLTLLDERGAMPPLQALSEQDATRPVVLIGFQKQGNLGIGYLAATLMRRGHRVKVLDFEDAAEQILATIEAEAPVVVGFSLIFQFYLPRFRDAIPAEPWRPVSFHNRRALSKSESRANA